MRKSYKEPTIKSIADQVKTLTEEMQMFRSSVNKRFEKVEHALDNADLLDSLSNNNASSQPKQNGKPSSIAEKYQSTQTSGIIIGSRRNTVNQMFSLSEGLVERLEQFRFDLRSALPHKSRGKINKSVVADMLLNISLDSIEADGDKDQLFRVLLNRLTH